VTRASATIDLSLLLLVACAFGCGGKLKDPERFDDVLASFEDGSGGSLARGDSGVRGRDSGAPGADSGPATTPDAGAEVPSCVTALVKSTCGTVACHDKGAAQIDLVSPGVTARLVDKASSSMLCDGRVFVATDGGDSLLLGKISDTPPCGARMPLIGNLTAAQRTCLTDWVIDLGGTP